MLQGKNDPYYDFVFGPDKNHIKYMIFRDFFIPFNTGGAHRRSIADIFVRLNPDKTFTVSITTFGRKLRIK